MKLVIITFLYSQPRRWKQLKYEAYGARHVNALYRACAASIGIPHRFVCLTDQPRGIECETIPVWPAVCVDGEDACYRRLRAFDGEFQRSLEAEHVLMLDLDVVFLRSATAIIEAAMERDFTILRGSRYPDGTPASVYNGGMWLCRAGAREQFWTEFSPEEAMRLKSATIMPGGKRIMGSDQAWISCISPNEATFDPEDGVAQYHMYRRRHVGVEPRVLKNASIVFFAGPRKPWGRNVKIRHPHLYKAWARYDEARVAA